MSVVAPRSSFLVQGRRTNEKCSNENIRAAHFTRAPSPPYRKCIDVDIQIVDGALLVGHEQALPFEGRLAVSRTERNTRARYAQAAVSGIIRSTPPRLHRTCIKTKCSAAARSEAECRGCIAYEDRTTVATPAPQRPFLPAPRNGAWKPRRQRRRRYRCHRYQWYYYGERCPLEQCHRQRLRYHCCLYDNGRQPHLNRSCFCCCFCCYYYYYYCYCNSARPLSMAR